MTGVLVIADKDGVLGRVWVAGGVLTGDSSMAIQLASKYQDRYGPDAYAELAKLNNGYVRVSEQPEPG